MKYLLGHYL